MIQKSQDGQTFYLDPSMVSDPINWVSVVVGPSMWPYLLNLNSQYATLESNQEESGPTIEEVSSESSLYEPSEESLTSSEPTGLSYPLNLLNMDGDRALHDAEKRFRKDMWWNFSWVYEEIRHVRANPEDMKTFDWTRAPHMGDVVAVFRRFFLWLWQDDCLVGPDSFARREEFVGDILREIVSHEWLKDPLHVSIFRNSAYTFTMALERCQQLLKSGDSFDRFVNTLVRISYAAGPDVRQACLGEIAGDAEGFAWITLVKAIIGQHDLNDKLVVALTNMLPDSEAALRAIVRNVKPDIWTVMAGRGAYSHEHILSPRAGYGLFGVLAQNDFSAFISLFFSAYTAPHTTVSAKELDFILSAMPLVLRKCTIDKDVLRRLFLANEKAGDSQIILSAIYRSYDGNDAGFWIDILEDVFDPRRSDFPKCSFAGLLNVTGAVLSNAMTKIVKTSSFGVQNPTNAQTEVTARMVKLFENLSIRKLSLSTVLPSNQFRFFNNAMLKKTPTSSKPNSNKN